MTEAPTVAPTKAPTVETRPTMVPTEAPATETPATETPATETPEEEPVVTEGVQLVYDAENSTETSKVVKAYYKGVEGLYGATVTIDADIALEAADFAVAFEGIAPTKNSEKIADGEYTVVFSTSADDPLSNEDALLGTYTLTVPAGTTDFKLAVTFVDITDPDYETYKPTVESWIIVPGVEEATEAPTVAPETEAPTAAPTPAPFEGIDVAIDDFVDSIEIPSDYPGAAFVAVVVDVINADGDEAVYGEDFVAVIGDKKLTADEYQNAVNGYIDNFAEVIGSLIFVAEEGTEISITPAFETTETAEAGNYIVAHGQTETLVAKQEEVPTETPDGEYVTIKLETVSGGTITATYKDEDGETVTLEEGDTAEVLVGTKVKFVAEANNNYRLKNWTDDLSGNSKTETVEVEEDMTVGAKFQKKTSGGGGGTGSGAITGNAGLVSNVGFTDLGSVPWAAEAINTLAALNVLNGRTDTIFDPNATVTRAEFAKMVCATFGIGATPNATPATFSDVSSNDWYYGYVEAAAKYGVVNGISDTEFAPHALVTREQMAAMLYRAIVAMDMVNHLPAGTAKTFADAAQISGYAVPAVNALSAAGVINGVTDTTFVPQGNATRAQAACIIYQYYTAIGAM